MISIIPIYYKPMILDVLSTAIGFMNPTTFMYLTPKCPWPGL